MSVLQMRTIMHEMEILASGGGGRALNTHLTCNFPIILRYTFKRKCVWEFMESSSFSDSYVTLFKKRLPCMPWVIVLVSREEIYSISHYGKSPQCYDRRMLAESRQCQNLSWKFLPQVCVAHQSFQTSFCLPGTSLQDINM